MNTMNNYFNVPVLYFTPPVDCCPTFSGVVLWSLSFLGGVNVAAVPSDVELLESVDWPVTNFSISGKETKAFYQPYA